MAGITVLDDFEDLSIWKAVGSQPAELRLTADRGPHGAALRLDFDFHGGGGFVVARREGRLHLPAAYAIQLELRGEAPPNKLEFKLIDTSGRSVWRWERQDFQFPAQWQRLCIRSRDIAFAWGPAGGGELEEAGAIELAIVAGGGGRGSVWLTNLCLEDRSPPPRPAVRASGAAPGHPPEAVFEESPDAFWRSTTDDPAPWIVIDLGASAEYGGLWLHWVQAIQPDSFRVLAGSDGLHWQLLYVSAGVAYGSNPVPLPGGESRWLRVELVPRPGSAGVGIARLELLPHAFSRSPAELVHHLAAAAPAGFYPKYWLRRQTLWTVAGRPEGGPRALLNEEGLAELDRASCTVEPFLRRDGKLCTWADAETAQSLEGGVLPIPSVRWTVGDLGLCITLFVADLPAGLTDGQPAVAAFLRYRLENHGNAPCRVDFHAAIRPFQVVPPWQSHGALGGVSPVHRLEFEEGAVRVDGRIHLLALSPPDGCGGVPFDRGDLCAWLARGGCSPEVAFDDPMGLASGTLRYALELAPGAARERWLLAPFGGWERRPQGLAALRPDQLLEQAVRRWTAKLSAVQIELPAAARPQLDCLWTCLAHILVNRDGAALQPGPRRYARAYIRDAAVMGEALLRLGCAREVRDFLHWYAGFQKEDGNIPCCVDRDGPDWLPEHDSHGQFVYLLATYLRHTGDRPLLETLWPSARRAVGYLERLRAMRLGPDFESGARRACLGLLPESVSHEGYLAQPVHAYWDDFWALRGMRDAAWLAAQWGDAAEAARLQRQATEFQAHLLASLETVMAARGIDYLPGCVEWADYDPTATANAITLLGFGDWLPRPALERTFDLYLQHFERRRSGQADGANYTPYEIRIAGVYLRLGRPGTARRLLDSFLADRRPPAWNQWPEIVWRDPGTPGHLGDLPHTWIAAEYILAFLDLIVHEADGGGGLLLGGGVPDSWLEGQGIALRGLSTPWGVLDCALRRDADGRLQVQPGSPQAVREADLRPVEAGGAEADPGPV